MQVQRKKCKIVSRIDHILFIGVSQLIHHNPRSIQSLQRFQNTPRDFGQTKLLDNESLLAWSHVSGLNISNTSAAPGPHSLETLNTKQIIA
jgi:hypothetical protein